MAGTALTEQAWKQAADADVLSEREIRLLAVVMEAKRYDAVRDWVEDSSAQQINMVRPYSGTPLLCWVAAHGRLEIAIKILAKPGIDFNVTDSAGKTPLDHAEKHSEKVADFLRKAGAKNGTPQPGMALTSD